MNLKIALSSLVFALTSGCATVHPPLKLYEGDLPQGQRPALLKPAYAVVIKSADGREINLAATGTLNANEYELQFMPGRHVLEVNYNSGIMWSTVPRRMAVELQGGRKYVIRPTTIGHTWKPFLLDVTDRPNCWTVSVGVLLGPSGCDE
ncbi:MAG: hypothetical protein ABW190_02760 [Rhizobacter sp.]